MASAPDNGDISDFQTPVTCGDCEGNRDVRNFCLDCNVNICETCKGKRLHQQYKVRSKGHTDERNARRTSHKCTNHPQKDYVTFCKTCNVPCCGVCISEMHSVHFFCSIDDAANEAREQVRTHLTDLETSLLPRIEQRGFDISDGITVYKDSIKSAREQCTKRIKHLKHELECTENDLKKQFDKIERIDRSKLDKIRNENEEQSYQTGSTIAACMDVLKNSNDIELLTFRSKIMNMSTPTIQDISLPPLVQFDPPRHILSSVNELCGRIIRRRTDH